MVSVSRRDVFFVVVDDEAKKLPDRPTASQMRPLEQGFQGYVGLAGNGDGFGVRNFTAQSLSDAVNGLVGGENAIGVPVGRISLGVVWRAIVVNPA